MKIFPQPKKVECYGSFTKTLRSFCIEKDDFHSPNLSFIISQLKQANNGIKLNLVKCDNYKKEQYSLQITNDCVSIIASTDRGIFNGIITLKQLIPQNINQCVSIDDYPDFEDRCLMLDYSRGRIPTIDEMKKTVDRIAAMKYNQIQMAFDSIVFEYKGLEKYYEGSSIVTAEYVTELQEYCEKNMIALVPNQNSFGHMHDWLKFDDLKDLAECPEGFHWTDEYKHTSIWQSGTLNPYDPRSLEFVDKIYSGLLPYFNSSLMHVCCDETYELVTGEGKSKDIVAKIGAKKVYTDYMNKLNVICQKYGKQMMFWSDMIIESVDALKDMPKDAIAVIWGYEHEYPFEKNCKNAHESGLDFYVAPGTCSWGSIVGRSNNMKYNQLSAAESGKKYGARGYLLTDWGDAGHVQFPVITYVPIAYGAGVSWGVDENKSIENACSHLDRTLFGENGFAEFLYDCGNAHCLEAYKRFNQTAVITALNVSLDNNYFMYDQTPEHFKNIIRFADEKLAKLSTFKNCPSEHIEELRLNLEILKTLAKVCIIKTGGEVDHQEIIAEFEAENIKFKKMWLEKNLSHFSDVYIGLTQKLINALN